MANSSAGITYALGQEKMAPLQIRVVVICWILNTLDGFDLLVIAFAAPQVLGLLLMLLIVLPRVKGERVA